MGGDAEVRSSSSSKKEDASCVDIPKSLHRLEFVVEVVIVEKGGAARQGLFAGGRGLGGGAMGLLTFC